MSRPDLSQLKPVYKVVVDVGDGDWENLVMLNDEDRDYVDERARRSATRRTATCVVEYVPKRICTVFAGED